MSVELVRINTDDRRAQRQFVQLPLHLHGNQPQWAPLGMDRDVYRGLRGDHAIYQHSDAAFFLARRSGRPVARIAAIDNTRFNDYRHRNTGFFGLYESVDDQEASFAVFDAALSWMSERGKDDVIGPRGLSGFDGAVLVEGFEHPATLAVPWNPPYYDRLVRLAGFETEADFLSGWFEGGHEIDPRIYRVAERALAAGYSVRTYRTRSELRAAAPDIVPVFLGAMSSLPGFFPPTEDEINGILDAILLIANPRGIVLVEKEGKPIGFLFSYPDLAREMRRAKGRLLPFGWFHLALARSRCRAFAINGMGIIPEERGLGANAVLYTAIRANLVDELGMTRCEVVEVASDNAASFKDMQSLQVTWYKRHRHYHRKL